MHRYIIDLMLDYADNIIKEVFSSACLNLECEDQIKFKDIPDDVVNKWYEFIWNYDVSKWKPRTDDRAFPDTLYTNKLYDVLEYLCYDLRDQMIEYLQENN